MTRAAGNVWAARVPCLGPPAAQLRPPRRQPGPRPAAQAPPHLTPRPCPRHPTCQPPDLLTCLPPTCRGGHPGGDRDERPHAQGQARVRGSGPGAYCFLLGGCLCAGVCPSGRVCVFVDEGGGGGSHGAMPVADPERFVVGRQASVHAGASALCARASIHTRLTAYYKVLWVSDGYVHGGAGEVGGACRPATAPRASLAPFLCTAATKRLAPLVGRRLGCPMLSHAALWRAGRRRGSPALRPRAPRLTPPPLATFPPPSRQRRDVRRAQLEQQYQQRMAMAPGPRGPMGPGMFPPGEPPPQFHNFGVPPRRPCSSAKTALPPACAPHQLG